MSYIEIHSLVLTVLLGVMTLLWLMSLKLKNAGIVDIFWGTGFVMANGIYFFLTPDGCPLRKWLITILVILWGLRLSVHILLRNWGKPEDFRYRKWREESGAGWWWQSLFKIFMLQGVLLWIISAPLLASQRNAMPDHLTLSDMAGIVLWVIGFFFESMGDLQLARWKSNPANKGRLMNTGVWRYTRHPNYFGDSAQWWGFYLIAVSAGGWWTIFSPILMTVLLVRVSGAWLLEKSMKTRPGYKEYIENTSSFIPWFPHH
jgi:steroid 5-alpha reductase family enzyme